MNHYWSNKVHNDDVSIHISKSGIGRAALCCLLCFLLTACSGAGKAETEPTEATEADRTEQTSEAPQAGRTDQEGSTENSSAPSETAAGHSGIEAWAKAFCRRDGETIAAMCDDEVKSYLAERELLVEGEDYYGFGWSSPWPWDDERDYEIIEETDDSAVILYYAWVSDPHVFVWEETLTYRMEDGKCIIEEETLSELNNICTGEEYARAYPHGINGTRMDYLTCDMDEESGEGIGRTLNDNALRDKSGGYYDMLFQPETAAAFLLNFLNNPNKVSASVEDVEREDGSVVVSFAFAEDGSTLRVEMIRPYGEEGIWIPQDYLVSNEPKVIKKAE